MIKVFPTINGTTEVHHFFENWDEVPLLSFIEYQKYADRLYQLDRNVEGENKKLLELINKYEKAHFEKKPGQAKMYMGKAERKQRGIDKILNMRHAVEAHIAAYFSTIPEEAFCNMEYGDLNESQGWNDNTFARYRSYLIRTANQVMPEDSVNHFMWQSDVDGTPGAKKKIEIEIRDIWEQSTIINKHLQELANDVVVNMRDGDFSDMPDLICMLTIDAKGNEIIEGLKNKEGVYVEKYLQAYKEELEKRRTLLFGQEKQISVALAMRIKNFFLHSYKR